MSNAPAPLRAILNTQTQRLDSIVEGIAMTTHATERSAADIVAAMQAETEQLRLITSQQHRRTVIWGSIAAIWAVGTTSFGLYLAYLEVMKP